MQYIGYSKCLLKKGRRVEGWRREREGTKEERAGKLTNSWVF
jgi:hypothetical protein